MAIGRIQHRFVQVARMGNPLVNELVIPTNMKDKWNATDAEDEAEFVSFYCNSALATALNLGFATGFPTTNQRRSRQRLAALQPGPTGLRWGQEPTKPWRTSCEWT